MEYMLEIGGDTFTLNLTTHDSHKSIAFSIHRKNTYTGVSIAHDSIHVV